MAGIELEGLQKRFGEVHALHSFDLSVAPGEFVSFLGPSGCGKTTALRIVAGFERPTAGRVLVGDKDVTDVPANRRDMGMVFQAYSLFPNMTAQENVAFGLRVRKAPSAQRAKRSAELLELVGLSAAAGRYPQQLSGGQQQRVALARALAIEPSVLLLDEPLSALDAKVRVQLRDEIRRIQTQLGITALFVTHDQEEALSISDRVVVMSQGQIEQVGKPAEIYGDPRTAFVAQFVGIMNRIPGVVQQGGRGLVEAQGAMLRASGASAWPDGSRVVLLLRPESFELAKLGDGAPVPDGAIEAWVKGFTFLGSVTRLRVASAVGELLVDVGSARALALGEGTRLALSWEPEVPRLIAQSEDDGTASHAPIAPAGVRARDLSAAR